MSDQGNQPACEDAFGPVQRRVQRAGRALRWCVKSLIKRPRRILVETRWRLGDEIMALPIYEALHHRFPDCAIQALCNYPDLLIDNPFVTVAQDPPQPPDRYINLRSGPRHTYRLEHYARRARIPTPTARPELYYRDWSAQVLDEIPPGAGPLVAVSSGATWFTKRWPVENWRTLCGALAASGCRVIELGRGHESIGATPSLMDRTTVREAACALHAADLFVCCDSGLMHLALAAGTRVVALFGPTDPSILMRNDPKLTVTTNQRPCQGCWNRMEEPLIEGVCPRGVVSCMETIAAETVLAQVQQVLHGEQR